jgi:hypothetical protein
VLVGGNRACRRSRPGTALIAALSCALVALAAVPALASALIVVNSAGDQSGAPRCEPGAGPGECTFRAAIEEVDASQAFNPIEFSTSVFNGEVGSDEIQLASPLPPIENPTTVIGHPVSGAFISPTVGVVAPAGGAALTVEANGVTVEDMAFGGGAMGIEISDGATGFKAKGDWFGLKLDASADPISGVELFLGGGAESALIGGTTTNERNVFANAATGIEVQGASQGKIRGNYIGVGPTGLGAASLETGVRITDSTTSNAYLNEIGGLGEPEAATHECVDACNVIATDEGQAVDLSGEGVPAATGPTKISGDYIGLGADGTSLVGENVYGVLAAPSTPGCADGPAGVTVGGPEPDEANFIEGGRDAIFAEAVEGFSAVGNVIGLAPDGAESASPEMKAIGLCAGGVTQTAHIAGNQLSLGPDTRGIESIDGRAQITGNTINGGLFGIRTAVHSEGPGDTIIDNRIKGSRHNGLLIGNDSNVVNGNIVTGSGWAGILLEGRVNHNRIGGDLAGEANAIDESQLGAIMIFGPESSRNEIAANTGSGNEEAFIQLFGQHGGTEEPNGNIKPPEFASARQSSASGAALPGSTVRIFSKMSAEAGELGARLATVTADSSGKWTAAYPAVPPGNLVAATQTKEGGTSEVSAPIAATADPVEPEKEIQGGGGTSGGSLGTGTPSPVPVPAKPTTPGVKITKGPKKSSKATTAKFKFAATPAAGATFECKLDSAKWAKCKPPMTYKRLKPGKHTFQVRASVPGAPTSKPAKFQFTVKP